MRAYRKIAIAAIAGAAIAVPATVVIAGGGGNSVIGDTGSQVVSWSGRQEAPKDWKRVPGLAVDIAFANGVISHTVSAEMTKGSAKFRIVPAAGGPAVAPGSVRFSAGAANSFTWGFNHPCGPGEQRVLEWKRVGGEAVAKRLSVHSVVETYCF